MIRTASDHIVYIHTQKRPPKAPDASPAPPEVSHASAAGPRSAPAQPAAAAGNTALQDRQSQILAPIDFSETVGGLRCLHGLQVGCALGTAAALSFGAVAGTAGGVDQISFSSAHGGDAVMGMVGGLAAIVGLVAGPFIPQAIDRVALRARRAYLERFPQPPQVLPARTPAQLLQDIEALAQRSAPLTADGIDSCIDKIRSLLQVCDNALTSEIVAQAYVRIAQSACRPSACGGSVGHAIAGVGLLAKELSNLRRNHNLSAQAFKVSMVALAMTLSAHRLSLKSAKEAATSLLAAYWRGTGGGERRNRLNFFTLLRGLPGFERVGRPGSTLSRTFDTEDLAPIGHLCVGLASRRPYAKGIDARTCIDHFLRDNQQDRCHDELADNSDRLFIGLARLDPLQVPQDLLGALQYELCSPPSDTQSITGAQQRVLDLLLQTLGQHVDREDDPKEAAWHQAPFEVLLALARYAHRFPTNRPLQELVARTTAPGRITDRLSRAHLAQLPALIQRAIDFARSVPQGPTQKVLLLHSILTHLEGRHTLESHSFIAGVVRPRDLIEVLSEVTGAAPRTDEARRELSEQVAALPRLCQLQSTPALLQAAWGAINRIWAHPEAAQGNRQAQAQIASEYRAQAREQVNQRILPEDSIPALGPQTSLNLHWLRTRLDDLPLGKEPPGTGPKKKEAAGNEARDGKATSTAAAAGIAPTRGDHGGTPTAAAAGL